MVRSPADEEMRRRNRIKFNWHMLAVKDPAFRGHWVIPALLDFIMHTYHVGRQCVEFSNNSAAKALDVDPRQIARAKKAIIERGWLRLIRAYDRKSNRWNANRYTLAGGPEDLLLDALGGTDKADIPE